MRWFTGIGAVLWISRSPAFGTASKLSVRGALPNAMTIEKMLAGQRSSRNHIIVEVLRDYGYVDARGMGVRTKVIPALKAGGAPFHFDVTEDYL